MTEPHDSLSVSVIICTRNRPHLVPNAVASVLANTYPKVEVIVVDQSDDARIRTSLDTFLPDRRFRYVHNEPAGLSRARNRGIVESEGNIIAFIDDDCFSTSGWVDA